MSAARARVLVPAGLLVLLAFAIALALNLVGRRAFYRVEARTEWLELTLRSGGASALSDIAWTLHEDSVLVDDTLVASFSGHVLPGGGARVLMRRSGTGPVYVEVYAAAGGVAGSLRAGDAPVATARSYMVMRLDPADSRLYTLPYFGAATLGDVVSSGGGDLLMEGVVSILGSAMAGRQRFVAAAVPLRMGDQVRIAALDDAVVGGGARGESPLPPIAADEPAWCSTPGGAHGSGIIRADGEPGLAVVHEASGRALRVSRVGAATHCFRPSLASFFTADPMVGALLIFSAGVLIALVQNMVGILMMGAASAAVVAPAVAGESGLTTASEPVNSEPSTDEDQAATASGEQHAASG